MFSESRKNKQMQRRKNQGSKKILKSKTYNLQSKDLCNHLNYSFFLFYNLSFCLHFPLFRSHWADFCKLFGFAASLSSALCHFLFVLLQQTYHVGRFFWGAPLLATHIMSDSPVPQRLFSANAGDLSAVFMLVLSGECWKYQTYLMVCCEVKTNHPLRLFFSKWNASFTYMLAIIILAKEYSLGLVFEQNARLCSRC